MGCVDVFVYQRHSKTEGRSWLELSHRDVHGFLLPPPPRIGELQCAPSSVELQRQSACGRFTYGGCLLRAASLDHDHVSYITDSGGQETRGPPPLTPLHPLHQPSH